MCPDHENLRIYKCWDLAVDISDNSTSTTVATERSGEVPQGTGASSSGLNRGAEGNGDGAAGPAVSAPTTEKPPPKKNEKVKAAKSIPQQGKAVTRKQFMCTGSRCAPSCI